MVQKNVAIFMIYRAFETKQYGDSAFIEHRLENYYIFISYPFVNINITEKFTYEFKNIILLERHN